MTIYEFFIILFKRKIILLISLVVSLIILTTHFMLFKINDQRMQISIKFEPNQYFFIDFKKFLDRNSKFFNNNYSSFIPDSKTNDLNLSIDKAALKILKNSNIDDFELIKKDNFYREMNYYVLVNKKLSDTNKKKFKEYFINNLKMYENELISLSSKLEEDVNVLFKHSKVDALQLLETFKDFNNEINQDSDICPSFLIGENEISNNCNEILNLLNKYQINIKNISLNMKDSHYFRLMTHISSENGLTNNDLFFPFYKYLYLKNNYQSYSKNIIKFKYSQKFMDENINFILIRYFFAFIFLFFPFVIIVNSYLIFRNNEN